MKVRATDLQNLKTPRRKRILWAVVLLAVLVRIAPALYQGNGVNALPGIADQISYHRLSIRVLEGYGFSFDVDWWPATPAGEPTAHWSYLYVLFLVSVYFIFGPNPIAARLIQAVLVGILQPMLTWRIGGRLFGSRVGLIAAVFSAFYAYFIYYSGALMTEAFYITAILWIVDLAVMMVGKTAGKDWGSKRASWILLGLAFALTVLLRQVFLLLVPVILIWLVWKFSHKSYGFPMPQLLGCAAISFSILFVCMAPWTLRNYRAFDSFVLLNTNAGFAFFWGNHPAHGTDFVPIFPSVKYWALIPEELRGLNEAEMEKALLLRGLDFVREDPRRYALLSISRIKEYVRFWPSDDSSSASNWMRIFSFGLFLPLFLSGLSLLIFDCIRKKGKRGILLQPGTSLLLIIGCFYTLIHLMTWTLIRYRLPVDAVFMPFAALGAVGVYDILKKYKTSFIPKMTKRIETS